MNPITRWIDDAKTPTNSRHVDTCDGVRTIAVLLVGWFHIWQQSWLYPGFSIGGYDISFDPIVRSGYIWVDIMILISGFCLYIPWARARRLGQRAPSAARFYVKRLIRVHPSYLLTVLIMFFAAQMIGAYASRAFMVKDLLTHLTYTHTFFYDTYYATNLGGAMWTLAILMQLYLLFPLLAAMFSRLPTTTFAVMAAVSLAYRAYVGEHFSDIALYFNQLPAYLDVFGCGMAAAAIHDALSGKPRHPIWRVLCSAATVLLCAALWQVACAQASSLNTEAIRLGQMARRVPMGVLGGLLLLASANAGLLVRSILANPLTRFFSGISMQFYIWHQTLAVFILQARLVPSAVESPNFSGDITWQLCYTAVCFISAILLAAAVTYGFERPVAKRLLGIYDRRAARGK